MCIIYFAVSIGYCVGGGYIAAVLLGEYGITGGWQALGSFAGMIASSYPLRWTLLALSKLDEVDLTARQTPDPANALMNKQGITLAAETRVGTAPNQQPATMEPPKSLPRPVGQKRDGTPKIEGGHRFKGANSIALRRLCSRLGTEDARFATVRNASALKQVKGESGPTLRATNPITGKKPRAIVLRSNQQVQQFQLHEQDGQGYDKDGNMGPVKAGDLKRDEKGHALQNTYERLGTYHAYHASDLNIQAMPEDRPPMSGEWADKFVAAKMAERAEAAGEPVRAATAEERTAILIEREMEKLYDMAQLHGVEFENAERDDYNFTVNSEGTLVIQVPAENPEVTLDQSYTSLAIACAHVEQFRSASDALAQDAAPNGDINLSDDRREQLQKMVDAYSLPEAERATNPDFSRADLVATYSAITEVTGHGGHYEAPESTRSEFNREQWAQELSAPGGFEQVDRDIKRAEEALAERMPRTQATLEQLQERQQQRTADTSRSIHDVIQQDNRDARSGFGGSRVAEQKEMWERQAEWDSLIHRYRDLEGENSGFRLLLNETREQEAELEREWAKIKARNDDLEVENAWLRQLDVQPLTARDRARTAHDWRITDVGRWHADPGRRRWRWRCVDCGAEQTTRGRARPRVGECAQRAAPSAFPARGNRVQSASRFVLAAGERLPAFPERGNAWYAERDSLKARNRGLEAENSVLRGQLNEAREQEAELEWEWAKIDSSLKARNDELAVENAWLRQLDVQPLTARERVSRA